MAESHSRVNIRVSISKAEAASAKVKSNSAGVVNYSRLQVRSKLGLGCESQIFSWWLDSSEGQEGHVWFVPLTIS